MKAAEKLRRAITKGDVGDVKAILKAEGNGAKEACAWELPTGGNALHYAASKGLVDIMSLILDTGVNVNCRRSEGDICKGVTPLHEAVGEQHLDAVRFLIKKGANVSEQDDNGLSSIHIACREKNVDLVQELFAAGAKVNVKDNRGASPLQVSILRNSNNCALFLLRHGADVQVTDKEGQSPLHYASEWETMDLVEALVAQGANVNLQDNEGDTPLHVTLSEEVFEFLVKQGADPTLRNKRGRPAKEEKLDMEKQEYANINKALSGHGERLDQRTSYSSRLQQTAPSRIFSPGPPIPEAELKTARTNMLKELQKRTGFEGPAIGVQGQDKATPRTPRSTGTSVVSPLAQERISNLGTQLSKTTIGASK